MGALKSGFDSGQGFPYESSSHMIYKVLYVNNFYSLYFHHHYDHRLVRIVIALFVDLELVYHEDNILLTCLFVCVIADSEYMNIKLVVFLESIWSLFSSGPNCVWSLWLLFITESFSLDTSGKATSTCSTV